MNNFVCKECGAYHFDCGIAGYRTHDDLELASRNTELEAERNRLLEEGINKCLMCDKFDFNKKIDELTELLTDLRDRFVSVTTTIPLGEDYLTLLGRISIALDESEVKK